MNSTSARFSMGLALAALIAGCSSKEPARDAQAGGQILEGSTSDAMLPYDTVRSRPPLAPRVTEGAKADASDAASEGSDAADAPVETPTTSPAAKPAAE